MAYVKKAFARLARLGTEIVVFGSGGARQGRVFPLRWDEYDYAPFFASLRTIGFDGRISVEASAKDFPSEAPQAIALFRRAFER